MQSFITRIQSSDHETKRNWLIGFCSITMVLIIGMWLIYMDAFVFKDRMAEQPKASDTKFWGTLKNGVSVLGSDLKEKTGALIYDFSKNTVTIQNNE